MDATLVIPPPHFVVLPLSQGESCCAVGRSKGFITLHKTSIHSLPLRQGEKMVFRGMTECHSVPSEGRNPHYDVGQTRRGRGYDVFSSLLQQKPIVPATLVLPPPHFVVLPLSQGESWARRDEH